MVRMPREAILCDCKNRGELVKLALSGSDVPLGEVKSYTRYFACGTCGDIFSRYETHHWNNPTEYSDWRKYNGLLFAEEIKNTQTAAVVGLAVRTNGIYSEKEKYTTICLEL